MRGVAIMVLVAAITVFYRLVLTVNPTTVALTFLAGVVIVSAFWQRRFAVSMALLSTLAYNFFFLPPLHTFAIAEGQNWVALFVYLLTALVATGLAERARESADTAERKRREVERLYELSQQILTMESTAELAEAIPAHIVHMFGAERSMLLLRGSENVYLQPPGAVAPMAELRRVIETGQPLSELTHAIVPVQIGGEPLGAIGLSGGEFSVESMQAVGGLIGIALKRAEAIEQLGRSEAARENARLRAALLDSVAHSFRTPLTSIKASVTGLLSGVEFDPGQRQELLTVIDEESDRLNRIVGEAAEMAQLDAGMMTLQFGVASMQEIVDTALETTRGLLQDYPVTVNLAPDLPRVHADARRITEVLRHLFENAAKFCKPGTPITISGERAGAFVRVAVADRGPGISADEREQIFRKFYRGRQHRNTTSGTGMGLAICKVIVEEHGGTIDVSSAPGNGAAFSFTVPADQ
jgi:two-component system, OmpR family, sensor histidine kinase KdpD